MYQHGRRTRQPRNSAVFLATISIVGIVITAGWFMVHKDIAGRTEPKTTVPIITEVAGASNESKVFNETYFSITLPSDWELLEHKTGNGINAYIYRSTAKGETGRELAVHVDVMPASYKLVAMQPLIPDGNKFILGNLSSECVDFSSNYRGGNGPFTSKWENVKFVCDPIKINQTTGTGTPGGSIGTRLGGHTYFFYFEDHNVNPDSQIFRSALQSFRSK